MEGWAGTHRNAVMWSGDDSGSFEYIRWQLPTFIGSGFSAQAHVSGDVDGIFGGSAATYVRDLQFKCLMTTAMVMSGWAANPDKQPWTFGDPYTAINRMYLKLKARLTPYIYSYSRQATDTGVPPIRAMMLEFPKDKQLYANSTATAYQFMSGEWLLVAPVYDNRTVRDGIYLPLTQPSAVCNNSKGVVVPCNGAPQVEWVDYWSGETLSGNTSLDNYPAPLDKLPIFVRAGAIVPLWPDKAYFYEKPSDPITLELWPQNTTAFSMYEDDGVTREALDKAKPQFATTEITVAAPPLYLSGKGKGSTGNVTVAVAAMKGSYNGSLATRAWRLNVRTVRAPPIVVLRSASGDVQLTMCKSVMEVDALPSGWFYDHSEQKGLLIVKTPSMPTAAGFEVVLSSGPAFPSIAVEQCDTVLHHQVQPQNFAYDKATKLITELKSKQCVTISDAQDPDSHTKAIGLQDCSAAQKANQQWDVLPSKQIASSANVKSCLNYDTGDSRVIMYGCHKPAAAGNQAFTIGVNGTQHVGTEGGKCWAVGALV